MPDMCRQRTHRRHLLQGVQRSSWGTAGRSPVIPCRVPSIPAPIYRYSRSTDTADLQIQQIYRYSRSTDTADLLDLSASARWVELTTPGSQHETPSRLIVRSEYVIDSCCCLGG